MPLWVRWIVGPFALRPLVPRNESYRAAVGRLLRERASSIVVFMLVLVGFEIIRPWSSAGWVWPNRFEPVMLFPLWSLSSAVVVSTILVEATGLRGFRLAAAMTLAAFGGAGVVAMAIAIAHPAPLSSAVQLGTVISNEAFLYRGCWVYSVAGLLFAAYCQMRERERSAMRSAREAELARADAQREIVASRLKVLQARVEPALLFDALADVRDAYLVDPLAADALLDDLVAYLRAALPQMRGGASTVAREAALVETYLRVVPAGRNKRLATHVVIAADLADDDFPPLVLLPLAHAAADANASVVEIVVPADQRAAAKMARSAMLRFTGHAVPAGWREPALHVVRETVRQYFGASATLVVRKDRDMVSATVSWTRDERVPASESHGLAAVPAAPQAPVS